VTRRRGIPFYRCITDNRQTRGSVPNTQLPVEDFVDIVCTFNCKLITLRRQTNELDSNIRAFLPDDDVDLRRVDQMYARRIPFIQKDNLSPGQLTPIEFARISPPVVSNPSDNLKNLFDIPTLFYALVLYLYATNRGTDRLLPHIKAR